MIEDVGHDDAGLLLSLFLSPALSLTHARAHAHTGTLSFSGPSLAPKQRQAQRQLIGGVRAERGGAGAAAAAAALRVLLGRGRGKSRMHSKWRDLKQQQRHFPG